MILIGKVSSTLLLNLIEDILDLAKFDANKFELNIGEFNLGEMLEEINYIFGFQCQERHLNFSINCRKEVSADVYRSDSKRIKQVLVNLVSNSMKFTQKGGITIDVSRKKTRDKKLLKFSVTDTGIGISKEDIKKLFRLFGMIDKDRSSHNQSGTGIGLCVSKKLVESLGGTIKAESREK